MDPSRGATAFHRPSFTQAGFNDTYIQLPKHKTVPGEVIRRIGRSQCTARHLKHSAMRLLPVFGWLRTYRIKEYLLADVVTGFTVAMFQVYTVGMFQMSRDVWRQLDIIMYFLVVTEFVLTSLVSVQSANANRLYVMFLQFSFITLISCRIIKTLQKRSVLFVWIWDLLDGILNRKLFYAYDLSWAYITAEDEAMVKVSRFVQTPHLALMIRANSGNNKLQTLRNVVDIQQRYPNIEVATKTRQAARRILNKAVDGLRELHEGGLIDDTQYGILFENLSWMIQKADGMPTNIVVGNAPFYTMLSVPWLPSEDVSKLLRCFYQYLKEKERLVQENRMHDCVFIICSGIVKVYTVGMFQMSRDVWRQLDIIMYFLVVTEFVLTSLVSVQSANANRLYVMFLQFSFITLISCRIIKTLQKRSVLFVWIWDLLDGILNRKLFYAYDLSWAYITAEDEAMVKVSRFVQTPHLALMIRANSGNNKLQKADGMPTNIVVGNAPFYTMLSVPWLPSEDVSKLLRCFYQYLKEKERLVQENRMHDCVFIICSGIVKVSGVNDEPWTNTGHLANSDSTHYFFTEGAFQDFLVAPEALGLLCFLTGKPSVCECVCETDVEMCSIPMDELTSLVERHPEPPNLVYRMWFSVAIRIGLAVLVNQKRYQASKRRARMHLTNR
ncbi:sodium/hydrogen exchanger 10-like [Ixodes scapularis]